MERTKSSRIPATLENFDELPDAAFVRLPTISALRGCSNATTWRHVQQGLIPTPQKIESMRLKAGFVPLPLTTLAGRLTCG